MLDLSTYNGAWYGEQALKDRVMHQLYEHRTSKRAKKMSNSTASYDNEKLARDIYVETVSRVICVKRFDPTQISVGGLDFDKDMLQLTAMSIRAAIVFNNFRKGSATNQHECSSFRSRDG